MYRKITDENILRKFWHEEHENMPQWYSDGTDCWHIDCDDFLSFCRRMWKIYLINDTALLYIENLGQTANIHFSLLRGADAVAMIPDFIEIRNKTFKHVEMIFGWAARRNKGLQKILEACGFKYYGFQMFHGESHGKILEWRCFSINRRELFVAKDTKTLLHLA